MFSIFRGNDDLEPLAGVTKVPTAQEILQAVVGIEKVQPL